jgi:hypothetical protein
MMKLRVKQGEKNGYRRNLIMEHPFSNVSIPVRIIVHSPPTVYDPKVPSVVQSRVSYFESSS